MALLVVVSLCVLAGGFAQAADVVVNEYNAVREDLYLQGTAEDPYLGRRLENGGDWFEVVVISDGTGSGLDMRGWDFVVVNEADEAPCGEPAVPPCREEFVLSLTLDPVWFAVRSGTIITVSEDIPNNAEAYQPETGSWWINVRANDNADGTFITPSNFKTSNDNTQITVRNSGDQVIFGPAGEGVMPASGVGNEEVWKLEETPTASTTPSSTYNDGASSTYGTPNIWSGGAGWQNLSTLRSVVPYSPLTSVVINEVDIHTDLPDEDDVELYNTTGSPVDISNWYLSDQAGNLTRYKIPATPPVPAGGYVVFTESQLGFGFTSTGEQVFLSEGNGTSMTGARNSMEFGAIENSVSWGRWPNGTGRVYRMSSRTLGAANAPRDLSDVVINELMYNPPEPGGGTLTREELEYVELYNSSGSAVDLFEDYGGGDVFPWRLNFGIEFDFCDVDGSGKCLPATGITLDADSYLLVVSFDPVVETGKLAEFRSHYGIDPSVPIYGPYGFGLNDFTDTVQLVKPDTPNAGIPPMVLYDEVPYFDFGEWPTGPDGNGPSLERVYPLSAGDDPANWRASTATGGTPGAANSVLVPALGSWSLMLMTALLAGSGAIASRRRALRGPRR
jgi:hypothetical protein